MFILVLAVVEVNFAVRDYICSEHCIDIGHFTLGVLTLTHLLVFHDAFVPHLRDVLIALQLDEREQFVVEDHAAQLVTAEVV